MATCHSNFTAICGQSTWIKGLFLGVPVILGTSALTYYVLKRKDRWCCTDEGNMKTSHPRYVIPQICREFHSKGWMTGSGGAISIKLGNEIFISPSGVPKESVQGNMLFVHDIHDQQLSVPHDKSLSRSSCAPIFMEAFQRRDASAVFHIHSQNAVLLTKLFPGKEFRVRRQQMIKAIVNDQTGRNYRYDEELVIPIVENENEEIEIKDNILEAMQSYPETSAVLVRHHGIYLWAKTWQKAQIMCEAYDYIFDTVVRMRSCGIDVTEI